MQLTSRLAKIADNIPRGTMIADIGTDHAYLAVYLVEQGICPGAVVGDLNQGPVESAESTVKAYRLENKIDIRQGDGLKILRPGEVDLVVLAGMGNNLIINILKDSPELLNSLKHLVLQPNKNPGDVRAWLAKNKWGIVQEELVEDRNKLYTIITFEPGKGFFPQDLFEMELGPCLLQNLCNPLVLKLLKKEEKKYSNILKGLSRSFYKPSPEKANNINYLHDKLKEALKIAQS